MRESESDMGRMMREKQRHCTDMGGRVSETDMGKEMREIDRDRDRESHR